MIRQKEGYNKNLKKIKKQKNYKKRLINKMKSLNNSYIIDNDSYYGKSSNHPSNGETYSIGNGRYFKILDSDGVIKTYINHSKIFHYREDKRIVEKMRRQRLKRLGDINITNKIWKNI